MVIFNRTHTCGALNKNNAEQNVTLCGWVHRHRNLGGIIFIDLRDRFGITQVVVDSKNNENVYFAAEHLHLEDVIAVQGRVVLRKDVNPNLSTGQIEVLAQEITVLSEAQGLPFQISDTTTEANEELRLQYRYLDMRRGTILNNLVLRHQAMMATRKFLDQAGFVEVSTPILGKATPEGARDYLVPSRIYPGTFYALPQSPQMFKQILMVGGLDRYFQIATCFRDEDLRHDRQPEFAQIDIEMSFATQEGLFPIIEKLVQSVFKEIKGVEIKLPFRRLTHAECMEHYGCDKPDLRFDMRLKCLDDLAQKSTFSVFHDILNQGGIVKGLTVKNGADISRKEITELEALVQKFGIKGLAWIKLQDSGLTSSIAKFLPDALQKEWVERLQMQLHDAAFVVAGPSKKVNQALDHLRRHLARQRNLIPKDSYEFLWVTDFPLFAFNEEENRLESEHHPFTSPNFDDLHLIESNPLQARSSSYDLVLNGYELASGSQRIHDNKLQDKIFEKLGLSLEERTTKFGFFLDALKYGTPPHIGIALGFDRMIMIFAQTDSIRDVIAFPKTHRAQDLMTKAPSQVHEMQLKELKITIK